MRWDEVFAFRRCVVLGSASLFAFGASSHDLTNAVRSGQLVRARRDHYLLPSAPNEVIRAVRIGGRLACSAALAAAQVFAHDSTRLHVHMDHRMSRSRSPGCRSTLLTPFNREGARLHWAPLIDNERSREHSVSIVDALWQELTCDDPWFALASIDNALHLGLVSQADIAKIFAIAPHRLRYLSRLVDGRAEAGQETVLRMIVRDAGLPFEVQVTFAGIGRVDLVVAGCLVVEADSRLAHDGWEKHIADRGRDLGLARLGYASLRPAYQHTMRHPWEVQESTVRLVWEQRNAVGLSGRVLP